MKRRLLIEKNGHIILEGVLQRVPPITFPGRIYDMYDYDWDMNKWIKNQI